MHRVAPAPAAQAVTRRKRVRWTWLPVAVLLAALAGTVGFLRVWPPLATVMSASMSPTIDTGDMVVLKRLSEPAHIGDIVVINVPTEARSRYGYPPVVIHRIVQIAADGAVTTKGDAHKEPDPFVVPRAAIATKVVATLPAAGRVIAFLSSGLGLLWLAARGRAVRRHAAVRAPPRLAAARAGRFRRPAHEPAHPHHRPDAPALRPARRARRARAPARRQDAGGGSGPSAAGGRDRRLHRAPPKPSRTDRARRCGRRRDDRFRASAARRRSPRGAPRVRSRLAVEASGTPPPRLPRPCRRHRRRTCWPCSALRCRARSSRCASPLLLHLRLLPGMPSLPS